MGGNFSTAVRTRRNRLWNEKSNPSEDGASEVKRDEWGTEIKKEQKNAGGNGELVSGHQL